jgi:hypothetical protein
MKDVLPIALSRRLILALAGFRAIDGVWVCPCGHETLSEEQVDTMSAREWNRYMRGWLASTVSAN